ncbi:hypothetical protein SPE26_29955 [Bacillus thuringiensis]|uniref:Uncharacterized protein n=1 Tax=Bacillus thuringiensis TaxID=1428 RepID=A0AAW9GQT1_BACTU|nr:MULTISPECIES: hypothetical protein [Bacillus cereus group]TKH29895.1 hypothetical protein FC690_20480 [Bacillus cereus]MDY0854991.1 hypothetical protein [Bacillus thuringiensis]MDY4394875.1 hypothetical protein [Bacillus thuringiensis]OUB76746.1 hypothetical protein BK744_09485 [Bacillus thuringiensis serovar zhaodongensis]GIX59456.1 hypothetical protein BPADB04_44860 [Bacillus paranthracis]
MKIISCEFNKLYINLDIALSPEEFQESDQTLQLNVIHKVKNILHSFGHSNMEIPNMKFGKFNRIDDDSLLCTIRFEENQLVYQTIDENIHS